MEGQQQVKKLRISNVQLFREKKENIIGKVWFGSDREQKQRCHVSRWECLSHSGSDLFMKM